LVVAVHVDLELDLDATVVARSLQLGDAAANARLGAGHLGLAATLGVGGSGECHDRNGGGKKEDGSDSVHVPSVASQSLALGKLRVGSTLAIVEGPPDNGRTPSGLGSCVTGAFVCDPIYS